ncbi:MAG: PIN domain-containing protein [Caldilineae bacterium]|nr:PIN domain-containing protein [Caldilineae bacterium]
MIAVDTNLLVYAHRRDSEWNTAARSALSDLAEGRRAWAIPWPCVHEFVAIVTHPKIYQPPSTIAEAIDQVEAWLESPGLLLLAEADGYWPRLRALAEGGRVRGPMIHDARVAALCRLHGVRELWTADRDFGRFPELRCRNVLLR